MDTPGTTPRILLASASPRRRELLAAAGYAFDVLSVDIDERVRPGEDARTHVRRLAAEKSSAAASRRAALPGGLSADVVVLGADTVVVVDDAILGKPRDDREAESMLRRLSGRTHEVMTGVSLRTATGEWGSVDVTTVEFSPLSDARIAWYVASGEGRDKAGAYAIQGLGSRFIPRIAGSYSNVVGLPVARVFDLLDVRPQ